MAAFLAGCTLTHTKYSGEMWLYLSDAGFVCEEDGAGAKPHRVPLSFRDGDPGWFVRDAPSVV
jgi:hypothetical protein